MSLLLKVGRNTSFHAPSYLNVCSRKISVLNKPIELHDRSALKGFSLFTPNKKSLLFNDSGTKTTNDLLTLNKRLMYTFRLSNRIVRNTHATRPRKTNNNSVELTYEQAQFAENLGVTKSWNSWNTSNLLDGKRQAENSFEDYTIRKFIFGTFHGILSSEIIIKRRFNQIDISFLCHLPRGFYTQKVYFLVGFAEELLSSLLKCVVKINPQTIINKRDLVFRNW